MKSEDVKFLKTHIWNKLASGLKSEGFASGRKYNFLKRKHAYGDSLVFITFVDQGTQILTRVQVGVRYNQIHEIMFPENPEAVASFGIDVAHLCGLDELAWPSNDVESAEWAAAGILRRTRDYGLPFLERCGDLQNAARVILDTKFVERANCLLLFMLCAAATTVARFHSAENFKSVASKSSDLLSRRCKPQVDEFERLIIRLRA